MTRPPLGYRPRPVLLAVVTLTVFTAVFVTTARPANAATAVPVVTNIAFPAAFTFDPLGRIFYVERVPGNVMIADPVAATDEPFFTVPNNLSLVAIALHPAYPSMPYVYLWATRTVAGIAKDQLIRVTDAAGTGTSMRILLTMASTGDHHGARLLFGPDDMLYLSTGDEGAPASSQNLNSIAGKVLRLNAAGAPAPGNPFGTRVFAYGLRNAFGFDFDPQTSRLWLADNGPACNDELDRIVSGGNYGWGPAETCLTPPAAPLNTNQDGSAPRILPKRWWTPTIAPTGVAFCEGCRLGADTEGALFMADWNGGRIRRLTLNATRLGVATSSPFYHHTASILGLETSPGGEIYFSDPTSIYRLSVA
jgi:glucose/arabinose dehydrogenase